MFSIPILSENHKKFTRCGQITPTKVCVVGVPQKGVREQGKGTVVECNDEYVSSDDDFEKVSRCSTDIASLSDSNQTPFLGCRIYTAAWDCSSITGTQFTWLEFAGTITQTGTILGYVTRPTAYLGLLVAGLLIPKECQVNGS
jgi:hypothetical protein